MNEWALITGASSGIGLELARVFAQERWSLVLLARNEARLTELADQLEGEHRIRTRVLPKDLSEHTAADEVFETLRDLPITALVNNAGVGFYGPFAQSDLREQHSVMQINMVTLVRLTHLFLKPMLYHRKGRILNVASTAAFQPGPNVSVYYASKAFVYSFSYALGMELEGTGVTLTTLCPGTTRTRFFSRGHFSGTHGPVVMDAPAVALAGYRGLMQGKRVVIPGVRNRILSALARLGPARAAGSVVRRIHR